MRRIKFGLTLTAIATLAACGGGGAGTNSNSTTASSTGTVAVGAPLSGATVTYLDATGTSVSTTTAEDGSYSISDLASLTTPIMIRASGTLSGQDVVLFSVMNSKPPTGSSVVANITPLTNAVVSQVALGESDFVFANPSNITSLTANNIDSSTAKLLTVLEATISSLGVSGIDPFKTAFKANSTGIDKLLDLVRVDSDPFGKIQVADKSTGVTKVIASTDSADSIAANKLSNVPDNVKNLEFSKIQTLIDKFNVALEKGNAIRPEDITPLAVPTGFLHKGENLSTLIQGIIDEPPPAGYKIGKYTIESCDPSTKVCSGEASLLDENGKPTEKFDIPLRWIDGSWYLHGNQLDFDLDFQPVISIEIPQDQTTYESSSVKFGFWLDQENVDKSISRSSYDRINVSFSNDSGTTFYPTWSLVYRADCNYFPEVNSAATGGCNNFLDKTFVPSSSLANFSAAKSSFMNGNLRIKVDVVSNGTTLKSNTFTPKFKAYSQEDVEQIAKKTIKLIKFNELGTDSITLLPRVHFINMNLLSAEDNSFINNIRVYGSDKLKSGAKITVTEICSLTKDTGCSTPHQSKIWQFFQNLRPEGDPHAMIFVSYSKTRQ